MARTTDSHLNPYTFGAMNNNAKATVKDVEGKLESALGELTGDPDHQVKGKVKQVHASAMKTAETLKEGAQSVAQKMDNTTHELAE
jgi:uncharacterized protein YjbJ (UPF0337 family)